MPTSNYLKITIGDHQIQVTDAKELPVSINYTLEDPENFQSKKSAEAFDIEIPATLQNDIVANTFRNVAIEDLTEGQIFKSSQKAVIESNGHELLVGKAFLKSAKHNFQPLSYTYNIYGDNADWLIDLQDKTFFDFLQHIKFIFSKQNMIDSWQFDGTDEELPYIFAPVRFRFPLGGYKSDPNPDVKEQIAVHDNVLPENMRPSISKYFILYWAFKSLGYKISSSFLDSPYFRRQVMPWTWGNFLNSDGTRLEAHKFRAVSTQYAEIWNRSFTGIWDLYVSDDSSKGFDNNDDYSYDSLNKLMKWEYKTNLPFGLLEATFHVSLDVDITVAGNSDAELRIQWFKNGVRITSGNPGENGNGDEIVNISAPTIGRKDELGIKDLWQTITVEPGDVVSARFYAHTFNSKTGRANMKAEVLAFELDYFRIPLGGEIDFQNYTGFKKYKFLDFLAGIVDEFDLSINTDATNKVVTIEPTHPYSLTNDPAAINDGYFVNDFLDWNGKEDLSKEWVMENYADCEKHFILNYKDDSNDGILKLIQDRNITTVGAGKYVFPDRFRKGTKERTNRFFSPVMHGDMDQLKTLGTGSNTGIAPQMVCIIPENVSNTSASEADNTFAPKSCYYKGLVTGAGAWRFDGVIMQSYPFMFAVNYQPGGENDPILSYSDENINGVVGKGLLKRFFWQRLAIMRNGQRYNTFFRLKNVDVAGQLHREFKSYLGQRWELIQIKGYKPLADESSACLLYKWAPITLEDYNNTFPSGESVVDGKVLNSLDTKYAPLKCLPTDLPE